MSRGEPGKSYRKSSLAGAVNLNHVDLMHVLDQMGALAYIADMKSHEILYINAYGRKLFGEVKGEKCWRAFQGKSGPCSYCNNSKLLDTEGRPAGHYRFEHKNERTGIWFECIEQAFLWSDGRIVHLEIAIDITARKQIEEALRLSEESYRILIENAHETITVAQEKMFCYINPAAEGLFNCTAAALLSTPFVEFIHPDDRKDVVENHLQRLKGEEVPVEYIHRIVTSDGTTKWVEARVVLIEWEKKPASLVFLRDISDRKRYEEVLEESHEMLEQEVKKRILELEAANKQLLEEINERKEVERALRASQEQYRFLLDNTSDLIYSLDLTGRHTAVNRSLCLALNRQEHEIIGKDHRELGFPEDVVRACRQILAQLLKTRKTVTSEIEALMPDGKTHVYDVSLTPVFNEQGAINGIRGTSRDITEKKMLEQEMLKGDKLESIGLLAGGIAHDFNNYLATLLGNISLAKLHENNPAKLSEKLSSMERATLRAKQLTQQLATFARGGDPVKKNVLIKDLVVDTISFSLAGSGVALQLTLADNLHRVEVDAGQISQVLGNITINAIQAMPSGGTIRVVGENVLISAVQEQPLPLEQGQYVKISIIDEGTGIPEENRSKIFDPFFTTKSTGSGLGLATAYSIVKNHGGCIDVLSELGAGSRFSIYLPASEQVPAAQPELHDILNGEGRILVMDDEQPVREVLGEMLASLGYESSFAVDGEDAVKLYLQELEKGRPFDLVLMDLTVQGGMGGKDTIKKLLQQDPELKAVISSGYVDTPVMSDYREYGFKGMLHKPYTLQELAGVIQAVLNE